MLLQTFGINWILFGVIFEVSTSTHWFITENGKIQSQEDTVFDMERPHDLLLFLEQERRKVAIDTLYNDMVKKKAIIDTWWMGLDSAKNVENNLYSEDPDCLIAGKPLAELDLNQSLLSNVSERDGIREEDYILNPIPENIRKKVPDCKNIPHNFEIYTFEQFNISSFKRNLTQYKEKGLMKYLPSDIDLKKFGHIIAEGLLRNETSWIYLNYAAIYWRIRGNPINALECSYRAILVAPEEHRDIPLLTTGGTLQASKKFYEAIMVLHLAVDYNPNESNNHLALGNVYTILGDYDRSIVCYDNCLKLSPFVTTARQTKHAILCAQNLQKSLTALHQHLQDILGEVKAYHEQQIEWSLLQQYMTLAQAKKSPSHEIHIAIVQEHPVNSLIPNFNNACDQFAEDNAMLSCNAMSTQKNLDNSFKNDVDSSLQLLRNMENKAKELSDHVSQMTKSLKEIKRHFHETTQKNSCEKDAEISKTHMKLTNHKIYDEDLKLGNNYFSKINAWAMSLTCDSSGIRNIDTKKYLPVYITLENKGFTLDLVLNDYIGLKAGEKHPLPWKEPLCDVTGFNLEYISMSLLSRAYQIDEMDFALHPILQNLVIGADINEIGQRILTATSSKVAEPWVLSMLASLYWRIIGKSVEALHCLQLALNTISPKFLDVPLISIASMYHKAGYFDDALRLANEAFYFDSTEPMTNFLIGTLLHKKGNNSGAIYHLKRALQVGLPVYEAKGVLLLKYLMCHEETLNALDNQ
ncbi:tetratricopeptide repeat protein 17 [Prorops nasuta]|uniref:tetratricopeptide repeat protein 17 n=1 Tax=Prorops nasuta TaxID=863751 RepID=UPI0034CDF21B